MPFQSILFEQPADDAVADEPAEPPFFTDLNLDQVLEILGVRQSAI